MVYLNIKRVYPKKDYTIGRFYVNGVRFYESLEDKDRGLTDKWTEAAIRIAKVFGKTAIPKGTYRVVLSWSEKFKTRSWCKKYGGLVPEILGVKGFSGVRIHPGNTAADTDGCPLLGENKKTGALVNSVKRYCEFMDKYMIPAYNRGEPMQITIE